MRKRGAGHDDLADYVLTGATGGQFAPHYMSRSFRHFMKLVKLPKELHFHSPRHTAASWLVMRGVSLPVVQAILGHSDISVTERYAHLAPKALRDEMARALGEIASQRDVTEEPPSSYSLAAWNYRHRCAVPKMGLTLPGSTESSNLRVLFVPVSTTSTPSCACCLH